MNETPTPFILLVVIIFAVLIGGAFSLEHHLQKRDRDLRYQEYYLKVKKIEKEAELNYLEGKMSRKSYLEFKEKTRQLQTTILETW